MVDYRPVHPYTTIHLEIMLTEITETGNCYLLSGYRKTKQIHRLNYEAEHSMFWPAERLAINDTTFYTAVNVMR
jgi:hypothetical protein